jgi:predicted ATPase
VDILDQLVQTAADTLPSDELRRLLGDEGRVLARYVPAIERLDPGARPKAAPALDPQGERVRFLSAVTAFLGRCAASQPRVLVIDDLQHADELSLQLTRHLVETLARAEPASEGPAQRFSPLALVFTLDPADTAAEEARVLLSRLSQERGFSSLALAALEPHDVQEMLASMIGGGDVAQALADYLHHETAGVPGQIEERVRAWAESGELKKKGRQWVLVKPTRTHDAKAVAAAGGIVMADAEAPVAPKRASVPVVNVGAAASDAAPGSAPPRAVAAPHSPTADASPADEVVELKNATRADIPQPALDENPNEQRVARLSLLARDVAERAAVVGDRVALSLLERVALRNEDELLDALDELIKRDILVDERAQSFLRFKDADDRDVLLDLLPKERRQHLHLSVARAIDDDARRHRRPANPEEQARHYLEGGESVRAIEQLMAAARISLAASATQSAAQRVGEAQELLQKEAKARPNDQAFARVDVELVLLRLDVLAAVNVHTECVELAKRRLPRMRHRGAPAVGDVAAARRQRAGPRRPRRRPRSCR